MFEKIFNDADWALKLGDWNEAQYLLSILIHDYPDRGSRETHFLGVPDCPPIIRLLLDQWLELIGW